MSQTAKVQIVQRNIDPRTHALAALTISVSYGDGSTLEEATILLRPGAVPNDADSIRAEIDRLGRALQSAAGSANGIDG
jgi:hypothetical protein